MASSEARDVLHQAMHPTLHGRIRMAIEIAIDFVVAQDKYHIMAHII